MKAKKMYLSVFLGVLLLSSCKTARDMVSENDICGEWNVVEIQGEPVRAQSTPFIGFDTKKGRVYGYSGCNRITGSLDLSRDNKNENWVIWHPLSWLVPIWNWKENLSKCCLW